MKKVFSLMLFVTSFLCFTSCSNDEDEFYTPQEVGFILDYTFVESGSMTRATGESVYNDFYEKYIKSKQLTPTTYSLTFQDKNSKAVVLTIDGNWNQNEGIRLPEGDYIVTGSSQPIEKTLNNNNKYPSDTVYLTFNEEVKIVKDMSNLVLKANYDAFLLLFDANNTEKISMANDAKFLSTDGSVFWLFMRDKYTSSWDNGFNFTSYFNLDIYRKNNNQINIQINNIPFEKGKYYYFNDMTNSFDIPKMESGN